VPAGISDWQLSANLTPLSFILVIIFVTGICLDLIGIILMFTLIFFVARVIVAPTVAMNLRVFKGITDEPLSEVIRGAYP